MDIFYKSGDGNVQMIITFKGVVIKTSNGYRAALLI